ncbi:MAG: SRPBCC family protein [Nitrospira sp.]|nr:SRPBCC family protein [Nitrospira sp.]
MAVQVTVRESLFVPAPPARVWDYTQDYECRCDWDSSIVEARVTALAPRRMVAVRCRGGMRCTFRYKADERPRRTSVAMVDVRSRLIEGGGGAWRYEEAPGGTLWTQVNTLRFRGGLSVRVLRPLLKWWLHRQTRRAMRRARDRIDR